MQFLWIMFTFGIIGTLAVLSFDAHQPEKVYNVLHDVSESKYPKICIFDLILLTCPLLKYKISSGIYDQMQFDVNDLCQIASDHTIWEIASSVLLSYKVMSKG